MDKKLLLSKIDASKREVMDAEQHLTVVIRETVSAPRAEKTTITEVVNEAIAALRAARVDLEDLHKLIADDIDK
jgi:hypothetical protein